VTELQVTACIFGSTYAFHLIAEANGVPFLRKFFVRLIVWPLQGFEVTHPIFDKLRKRLPDAFHHLVLNDNFHCQMRLKMPNLTYLAVKMPVGKSGCAHRLVNCNSPIGYGMHFPAILSNYNGMTVSVHLSSVYTDYSFSSFHMFFGTINQQN